MRLGAEADLAVHTVLDAWTSVSGLVPTLLLVQHLVRKCIAGASAGTASTSILAKPSPPPHQDMIT